MIKFNGHIAECNGVTYEAYVPRGSSSCKHCDLFSQCNRQDVDCFDAIGIGKLWRVDGIAKVAKVLGSEESATLVQKNAPKLFAIILKDYC